MTKQKQQKPGTANSTIPGFFRYFAAIFYDLLLLIAIFFLATAILLPFNAGEAIKSPLAFPLYLYSIGFLFYGWFWTHGGQTLGLQAWKLRLISNNKSNISWQQAFIRYISASCSWLIFGLGFFWRLWQQEGKTLHDLSSQSYIIRTDINVDD
ncbi:MAG: RDD family protein [Methyloprofundus sp.]|nr:RDD family protein [Methyloprofundus sp.]